MSDGILFPTKAAFLHSQQEIGFIYKNHSPKLEFAGLPTFPPSFSSPPQDISSLQRFLSNHRASSIEECSENLMAKHWGVFSRRGN